MQLAIYRCYSETTLKLIRCGHPPDHSRLFYCLALVGLEPLEPDFEVLDKVFWAEAAGLAAVDAVIAAPVVFGALCFAF
jgi:hypothetical protein